MHSAPVGVRLARASLPSPALGSGSGGASDRYLYMYLQSQLSETTGR